LNGSTSGLNWLVSGQQEGVDWIRIDAANRGGEGGVAVEWPTAGVFSGLTYSGSPGVLGIGQQMPAHLGTLRLRIAEVTPPGTYGGSPVNQVSSSSTGSGSS
jgi:hypothetical protein